MKAKDFQYGEHSLSSFGMMLCRFGSSGGLETVDGVSVTFNTVPVMNGQKHESTSVVFESCLETTLQICKYSCSGGVEEITETEQENVTRWLMRDKFLKFKPLDEDHINLYYEAAFDSVSKIEIDGRLFGLEFHLITNRPFSLREPRKIVIENTEPNGTFSINDTSHKEGYIYPFTEITVLADGDLSVYNAIENRTTLIKNCVAGEIITMDYPIMRSSIQSHRIQDDFNYIFFRIANSYNNSRNDLTISLPCTIKATYSPIVKVGL